MGTAEDRPVITLEEENPTPSIPLMRILKGQYAHKNESFTHPRAVSNLYEFPLLNTKEDILEDYG